MMRKYLKYSTASGLLFACLSIHSLAAPYDTACVHYTVEAYGGTQSDTVPDASGNSQDGLADDEVFPLTPTAGVNGNSAVFPGGADIYVSGEVPPSSIRFRNQTLDLGAGDYTITMWVRATDAYDSSGGPNGRVWSVENATDPILSLSNGGKISYEVAFDSASMASKDSFAIPADSEWYHVAVVVNRDNLGGNPSAIYLNSANVTGADTMENTPTSLTPAGAEFWVWGRALRGQGDDFAIFKDALSQSDIAVLNGITTTTSSTTTTSTTSSTSTSTTTTSTTSTTSTTLFNQDFETWPSGFSWGTTLHDGWTLSDGQARGLRSGFGPPIDGSCGWLYDFDDSTNSWLKSPVIPTGEVSVVFWTRRNIGPSLGGSSFAVLETSTDEINWMNIASFAITNIEWTRNAFTIDSVGATYMRIRKTGDTASDTYAGIDNVEVMTTTSSTSTTTTLPLKREPYLQIGAPSSMTLKWRTGPTTDTRVVYGTTISNLSESVIDTNVTVEHEITVTGLVAETKYFYAIGTTSSNLAGPGIDYHFRTAPAVGEADPTRIWVIGDSGTANSNAAAVRDAYYAYTGTNETDVWLMLGDNAYQDGTDIEYQTAVFDMYPTLLRNTPVWPTLGNHDGNTADSATESGPYYDIFSLPRHGQAGGLASGTEAYYSFDHANIHFICLDSHDTDSATNGTMMTWVRNDLSSTMQDWIIAFWHHPPYSKGSHDSDVRLALVEMRENALPILEAAGVDLVLTGHSHSYERSYYLRGHYGDSSTLNTNTMFIDAGDGRPESDGAYSHETGTGTVYIVAGSSGSISGGSLDHPVMFLSLNELGSLVLDVNRNVLNATFIDDQDAVRDNFTIDKTPDLTVDIPIFAAESSGTLFGAGCVSVCELMPTNLTIILNSDDLTEITVPPSVTILQGQSSTIFDLTILEDSDLDGAQFVTISASAEHYDDGSDTIGILDNESAMLSVSLPPDATEGDGVLVGAGSLSVDSVPDANIIVALSSDNPGEVIVPDSVIIPSGATNVSFDVTVVDDTDIDGNDTAVILAQVPNWTNGQEAITIFDNDVVDEFFIAPIPSPQIGSVPFNVAIEAHDINAVTVTAFIAFVGLSASGDGGAVLISPDATEPFNAGVWNGLVTVTAQMENVVLMASKDGRTGVSNPFDVVSTTTTSTTSTTTTSSTSTTTIPGAKDFGDAPSPYPTLLGDGGARHVAVGPTLGVNRDIETNGLASVDANGDDMNNSDDEDGVAFDTPIQVGQLDANVTVIVSNAPGGAKLDAWIDFNADGSWGGPFEQIASSNSVVDGSNAISFDVPSWAVAGTNTTRFRLSTSGSLGPGGPAGDGEVEDHPLVLNSPSFGCRAFSTKVISTTATSAQSVFAADVDSDGDMDVISGSLGWGVAWHENDGNQNFSTHAIYLNAFFAISVFAADVDGDGDMDVIAALSEEDEIEWYENDGSQNFTAHVISAAVDSPRSVSAADVDSDGDLDVLSASSSDNKIAWHQNDGNQNFSTHNIDTSAIGARSVFSSDVDGDGDMDVLSAASSDGTIAWYENDGNQIFSAHDINTVADGASSVFATDVDRDGDMDVLSASAGGDEIAWYENDGNQNFSTHTITSAANGAISVFAADVDGDGDMDVISAAFHGNTVAWYENDGGQNFSTHFIHITFRPQSVFSADVDGDGDMDVLSTSRSSPEFLVWHEQVITTTTTTTTSTSSTSTTSTSSSTTTSTTASPVITDTSHIMATNYTFNIVTVECPPAVFNCGAVLTQSFLGVIGFSISWPSELGRLYSIDERVIPDTNWNRISADTPATPPMNTYSNLFERATNQAAIYRVMEQDDP